MSNGYREWTTQPPEFGDPNPTRKQITEPPEFIPMPPVGQTCPYTGLRRGLLYALWQDGEIESVSLRRRGKVRGRRFFVYATVKAYLNRKREEQRNDKSLVEKE